MYANIDDTPAYQKVRSVTSSIKAARQLRIAQIGVVGEHQNETSELESLELVAKLGVAIVPIELIPLIEQVRAINPQKISFVYHRLEKKLSNLANLDPTAVNRTIGLYLALKEIAKEKQLDGIALRGGSEFFANLGCSTCGAISLLNENGIPSSCEGDVNGTLIDLILHWLSGSPAVGVSLVSADFKEDRFIVWNCGLSPLSLADPTVPPRGSTHPDHGLPLTMAFPLKKGKVTIARLSRTASDYRLVVGIGEMSSSTRISSGTGGVLRFENSSQEVLDTILAEGLEHRISITYGHLKDRLLDLREIN